MLPKGVAQLQAQARLCSVRYALCPPCGETENDKATIQMGCFSCRRIGFGSNDPISVAAFRHEPTCIYLGNSCANSKWLALDCLEHD
jgi:hypothetical protein